MHSRAMHTVVLGGAGFVEVNILIQKLLRIFILDILVDL